MRIHDLTSRRCGDNDADDENGLYIMNFENHKYQKFQKKFIL